MDQDFQFKNHNNFRTVECGNGTMFIDVNNVTTHATESKSGTIYYLGDSVYFFIGKEEKFDPNNPEFQQTRRRVGGVITQFYFNMETKRIDVQMAYPSESAEEFNHIRLPLESILANISRYGSS